MSEPHSERLHFRIGLSGTYWDKRPEFSICINNNVQHQSQIVEDSDAVFYVEFTCDVAPGANSLGICLLNKDDSDTIQNADHTQIVKDLLLNIHSVEIDEIDLGNLIWTHTQFKPLDPQRPTLEKCVNLGWNGTWTLDFQSPFYVWLLENI